MQISGKNPFFKIRPASISMKTELNVFSILVTKILCTNKFLWVSEKSAPARNYATCYFCKGNIAVGPKLNQAIFPEYTYSLNCNQ